MKKHYHFSLGNSSDGPIGYCAEVCARSAEDAVKFLRAALWEHATAGDVYSPGIIYIEAYMNENYPSERDIDEVVECDCGE